MGWKKSAPYGASDLAKIRAGFLHKAERLLHGAQIAKNLENSDKWYYFLAGNLNSACCFSSRSTFCLKTRRQKWGPALLSSAAADPN